MAPGNVAIAGLVCEFNLTEATLYAWRRAALRSEAVIPGESSSSVQWLGAAKFSVVLKTASLAEMDLGEYSRKNGLFSEQMSAWRELCEENFDHSSGCAARAQKKPQRSGGKSRKNDQHPRSPSGCSADR